MEVIFFIGVVLLVVMLAGHGLWLLLATIVRQLFGVRKPAPPPPWPAEQMTAEEITRRELRKLLNSGAISPEMFAQVNDALAGQKGGGPPPLPVLGSADAPSAPMPTLPMHADEGVRAPRNEHRPRGIGDVLAAFMLERNIRWGELIGGLLIVGCSVALAVSLWAQISERPLVKFLVFTAVTAGLFAAGLYSQHRWKLPHTSRGILLTAALLVPLNFLAFAAFGGGREALTGQIAAAALFAWLLYLAGKVIARPWPILWAASIMALSLIALLADYGLRMALIPPVLFALLAAVTLRRAWTTTDAGALMTWLGTAAFAAGCSLLAVLYRQQPDQAAMRLLSPVLVLACGPLLLAGALIWRRMEGRERHYWHTAGGAVAGLGAMLLALVLLLAWPDWRQFMASAGIGAAISLSVAFLLDVPALLVLFEVLAALMIGRAVERRARWAGVPWMQMTAGVLACMVLLWESIRRWIGHKRPFFVLLAFAAILTGVALVAEVWDFYFSPRGHWLYGSPTLWLAVGLVSAAILWITQVWLKRRVGVMFALLLAWATTAGLATTQFTADRWATYWAILAAWSGAGWLLLLIGHRWSGRPVAIQPVRGVAKLPQQAIPVLQYATTGDDDATFPEIVRWRDRLLIPCGLIIAGTAVLALIGGVNMQEYAAIILLSGSLLAGALAVWTVRAVIGYVAIAGFVLAAWLFWVGVRGRVFTWRELSCVTIIAWSMATLAWLVLDQMVLRPRERLLGRENRVPMEAPATLLAVLAATELVLAGAISPWGGWHGQARLMGFLAVGALAVLTGVMAWRQRLPWIRPMVLSAAAVLAAWVPLPVSWRIGPLHHLAMLAAVVSVLAYVYGRSGRCITAIVLATIGVSVLPAVLLIEIGQTEFRHPTVIAPWAFAIVLAGFMLYAVGAIRLALRDGPDPLNLSGRGRMLYIYGAELLAAGAFLHVRLCYPQLFNTEIWRQYWPIILMLLAFATAGLAEFFHRRDRGVLAEPLQNTAAVVPLAPVAAYWWIDAAHRPTDYAIVLLLAGGVYALLAALRRSFGWGLAAVAAGNAALWSLLHRMPDWSIARHPQLWLIPPALSLLVAAQLNRRNLGRQTLGAIRYVCLLVIYLSSTADIFFVGVGQNPWLAAILGLLAIVGVLVGMAARVLSFLLLGTAFLLVALVTIIYHASVNLHQTWLIWLCGIALGAGIIALFAVFEKQRERVTAVVERFKAWEG